MNLYILLLMGTGGALVELDMDLLELKGLPTATEWTATKELRSYDPAFQFPLLHHKTCGLKHIPPELQPLALRMLRWRKIGLQRHYFCRSGALLN